MLSSRCRGTIVTISISARKATSEGVRPGGKGWAILYLYWGELSTQTWIGLGFLVKGVVKEEIGVLSPHHQELWELNLRLK